MTVTLNGAASSSSSGAYAPVAAASFMWASRASADSQSAISTRTSGSASTPYRVLPRKPSWPGPCVAIRPSSTCLSSSRRPGLACSSTITLMAIWSGLCRRAGGHDAELLHQRQHVRDTPVLTHQAGTVEPHDVDELHVHVRAGRRHPHELALVRSGDRHPRHGLVPARDQVLDGHMPIGKRGQQDPEELERPLLRGKSWHALVLDEVIRYQVAEPGDVSRVDPLVGAPHRRSVVHGRPLCLLVAARVTACERLCWRPAAKTSLDRVMYRGGERNPVRHLQLGEYVPEVAVHGVR